MIFKMTLLKKLMLRINGIFRVVFADEGDITQTTEGGSNQTTQVPTAPVTASIDFESLIAKARKEEKEKLYPEITKLKEELDKKTGRINDLLLAIGEKDELISQRDKEIKDLKANSRKTDSQEVKDLNLKLTQLENQLTEKDKEITNIKLSTYKATKIAEAGGEIIPELVMGSSEEEIDLAVETAKARYKEIVGKYATQAPTKPQSSNNIPPVNPQISLDNKQVSAQNLSGLNMLSAEGRAEYARIRKQLGMK